MNLERLNQENNFLITFLKTVESISRFETIMI